MSLRRMNWSTCFTNRANSQCGLRVELYNILKPSCQGTGIFRIIHIFVTTLTIYDAISFIRHATFRIAHSMMQWSSQVTKNCNRHTTNIFVKEPILWWDRHAIRFKFKNAWHKKNVSTKKNIIFFNPFTGLTSHPCHLP